MIIVLTGDGKGKTTSSLGQAVRALGRGKRVLMIQFIKGPWRSGEDEFAEKIKSQISNLKYNFEIRKMGLGFVGILGDKLPREEHEKAARAALQMFIEEREKGPPAGGWHLMILDEVNVAVSLGLIPAQAVLDAAKDFPEDKILMLTGRGAPQEFIGIADLATEMREIKHPFRDGKKAKMAVEF